MSSSAGNSGVLFAIQETGGPVSNRPFACPFYKFNPHIYDPCKRFHLKRMSDVRQHLVRRHSLPAYSCSECWCSFKDERSRFHHLRHDNCQSQPQPEELSPEEIDKMKHLRFGDTRSHWFAIWDQIFRGFAAPPSPHIQSNQIEEFRDLIGPSFETALHAALPILLQKNSHGTELSSIAQLILDDACSIFYRSLPTSRHEKPRRLVENGDNTGPSSQATPSELALWDGDSLVDYGPGLELGQYETMIDGHVEFDMALNYDGLEPGSE